MTPHKILGLAVSPRSIAAAEVGIVHGRKKVLHTAVLTLPEADALANVGSMAKTLRQFLRHNHFSASRCVIGLAADRLVAKEKTLPPTAPDMIVGVLSIATEREFASDPKDYVFDYSGPVTGPQGPAVLLVAASRQDVTHWSAVAEEAGLHVLAITSSTMSLTAATTGRPASQRLLLHLTPTGPELCAVVGGGYRLLRRLSIAVPAKTAAAGSPAADWLDDLAGELRRIIALMPGAAPGEAPELLVWNSSGIPTGTIEALGERLSAAVRVCPYPAGLDLAEAPAAADGEFVAPAALALAGFQKQFLAVDFAHSRLQPRKQLALKGKILWAAAIAVVVFGVGVTLLLDWRSQQREIADLNAQLTEMKPNVAVAKNVVDKVTYARGWYDQRPPFLKCLNHIFVSFPISRVWATSLRVDEEMHAVLSGKGADQAAVMDVADRLKNAKDAKKNPTFKDVKILHIRGVEGGSTEVSFSIELRFVKAEGT
jgi:hypothetical protein